MYRIPHYAVAAEYFRIDADRSTEFDFSRRRWAAAVTVHYAHDDENARHLRTYTHEIFIKRSV